LLALDLDDRESQRALNILDSHPSHATAKPGANIQFAVLFPTKEMVSMSNMKTQAPYANVRDTRSDEMTRQEIKVLQDQHINLSISYPLYKSRFDRHHPIQCLRTTTQTRSALVIGEHAL
jgi:hypothetical protein